MYPTNCPSCGHKLEVADEDVGKQITCHKCGQSFIHPSPQIVQPLPSLQPHHGGVVLALGSLSWVIWTILARIELPQDQKPTVGVIAGVTGLIFGILAWILGSLDLRAMKEGKMDRAGRAMTKVGMAMGSILTILVICVFFAFLGTMLLMPPKGK